MPEDPGHAFVDEFDCAILCRFSLDRQELIRHECGR